MITALFTMKHDRCKVFLPAILTMMGMHLISVAFGSILTSLVNADFVIVCSILIFFIFGIMMIREASRLQVRSAKEKIEELDSEFATKNKDGESLGVPAKKDEKAIA